MVTSGILNGILGILLTFLPQEIGRWLGTTSQTGAEVLILQLLGGALFGIGLMNYMGRNAVLGGIYGKPIILGNMVFHFIAAIELIKYLFDTEQWVVLFIPAILYSLLTAGLIRLNFTSAI